MLSLLILTSPFTHAIDNSITEDPPNYYGLEKMYLKNKGLDRTDDIEWNQGQATTALIFDPNGTATREPIRNRSYPYSSGGAYLDTTTGNIYVEDLFGDSGQVKILNFTGTELVAP